MTLCSYVFGVSFPLTVLFGSFYVASVQSILSLLFFFVANISGRPARFVSSYIERAPVHGWLCDPRYRRAHCLCRCERSRKPFSWSIFQCCGFVVLVLILFCLALRKLSAARKSITMRLTCLFIVRALSLYVPLLNSIVRILGVVVIKDGSDSGVGCSVYSRKHTLLDCLPRVC